MIIDASVASHWFVETEFSEAASKFRWQGDLIGPGFLLVETANVLYKRSRRGEINLEDCSDSLNVLRFSMSELISDHELLPRATAIAFDTLTPVYDSLYLALALERSEHIVTGDKRLVAVAQRLGIRAHRIEPA
jgi:predicted nucleic acid-binding protein